jgi:hypothetical protein
MKEQKMQPTMKYMIKISSFGTEYIISENEDKLKTFDDILRLEKANSKFDLILRINEEEDYTIFTFSLN